MRFQGKIKQWDESKGFGFIEWNGSSDKLFVHISAFADRSRRPAVGDIVTYEAERDAEGRHKAIKVMYPGAAVHPPAQTVRRSERRARRSRKRWLPAVAISGAVAVASWFYFPGGQRDDAGRSRPVAAAFADSGAQDFRCEGKKHCSQMDSCEEASFYLKNCPGTAMDGDNDGIPCEDRCGH